jgi:hypothetical protein
VSTSAPTLAVSGPPSAARYTTGSNSRVTLENVGFSGTSATVASAVATAASRLVIDDGRDHPPTRRNATAMARSTAPRRVASSTARSAASDGVIGEGRAPKSVSAPDEKTVKLTALPESIASR